MPGSVDNCSLVAVLMSSNSGFGAGGLVLPIVPCAAGAARAGAAMAAGAKTSIAIMTSRHTIFRYDMNPSLQRQPGDRAKARAPRRCTDRHPAVGEPAAQLTSLSACSVVPELAQGRGALRLTACG